MDELIKRKDAMQAIAQLAIPSHIQQERILDALQKVPAADAVEVVRCKDCRFWVPEFDNVGYCDYAGVHLDHAAYGFCSYGERK